MGLAFVVGLGVASGDVAPVSDQALCVCGKGVLLLTVRIAAARRNVDNRTGEAGRARFGCPLGVVEADIQDRRAVGDPPGRDKIDAGLGQGGGCFRGDPT